MVKFCQKKGEGVLSGLWTRCWNSWLSSDASVVVCWMTFEFLCRRYFIIFLWAPNVRGAQKAHVPHWMEVWCCIPIADVVTGASLVLANLLTSIRQQLSGGGSADCTVLEMIMLKIHPTPPTLGRPESAEDATRRRSHWNFILKKWPQSIGWRSFSASLRGGGGREVGDWFSKCHCDLPLPRETMVCCCCCCRVVIPTAALMSNLMLGFFFRISNLPVSTTLNLLINFKFAHHIFRGLTRWGGPGSTSRATALPEGRSWAALGRLGGECVLNCLGNRSFWVPKWPSCAETGLLQGAPNGSSFVFVVFLGVCTYLLAYLECFYVLYIFYFMLCWIS